MRDFPHDCGMVDTYVFIALFDVVCRLNNTFIRSFVYDSSIKCESVVVDIRMLMYLKVYTVCLCFIFEV